MEASFSSVSSNSNMSGAAAIRLAFVLESASASTDATGCPQRSITRDHFCGSIRHIPEGSASVWPHCGKKPRNQNRRGRDEEPTESLHAQPPEWRHHSPASPATRTCPAQPQSDWGLYWNPRPLRRTPPASHSDQSHATTSADRSATYPKSIWFLPSRYPLRR